MTGVPSAPAVPVGRAACGLCTLLQEYGCPCQQTTCRARALPGTLACDAARAQATARLAASAAAATGA